MHVLGIETTCDETAAAVVVDGKEILSNIVSSQVLLHEAFGGVVPELSCRRHIEVIDPVVQEALMQAKITLDTVDVIAVAYGPGLIGALQIGTTYAKALAWAKKIPLIGVNHVQAHLYAAIMSAETPLIFPAIGAIISGGHTALLLMHDTEKYTLLGETVDDALGEAFDKVAKMLGLPYPGGPEIEKLAEEGDPTKYPFKSGTVKKLPYHFSFSGIKTAVLYALQKKPPESIQDKKDIAASFQYTVVEDIVRKTLLAKEAYSAKAIYFGGGVTNNNYLRNFFSQKASIPLFWPKKGLVLDNAAMIAGLGYARYKMCNKSELFTLDPITRIPF